MKRILAVATLLLSGMVPVFAQTPAPTPAPVQAPPVQHFVISGQAAGYGGQQGTQAVMIAGVAVNLTEYVSVGYDRISNPSDTKQPVYNLADVNVAYELGNLLPSKLKSKLNFDTSNWIVTFQGSAGKITAPGVNRIAEGVGAYVSRPMSNNVQLTCGYRVLFPGHVLVKQPSVGINFTF